MSDLLKENWDVIVIGTGIGGGTAGRRLAEAGLKVLFIEKGPAGFRSEQTRFDSDMFVPEARLARGFWPNQVQARINGEDQAFYPPIGAGLGGSSAFYAATLERPEVHDLEHSNARPHPTGGWPVRYAEFEPYLTKAEQLYHVNGTQNPLANYPSSLTIPPTMDPVDQIISDKLSAAGMHPYQLHSAVRNVEGCLNCFGTKCPKPCKMDGRSAGVEPALATGNAGLLDMADVTALCGDGSHITHIKLIRNAEEHTISAPVILLAAGAFGTPQLCLQSASEAFPNGVANSADRVGRGLMFHTNEMFAVWPGAKGTAQSKSIGMRDLMWRNEQRLGMVQSMGVDASYGEILHYLRLRLARSKLGRNRLVQDGARLPAAVAAKVLGRAKIFLGLMEDLSYDDNRILPTQDGEISFKYTMRSELHTRRKLFQREIKRAFKGQRMMFLLNAPELNFGHPCGTMRFGDDATTSVLRSDGRAHDLTNLYVADASFMPSSMGVNPSLTIAAQALRVADAIIEGGRHGET